MGILLSVFLKEHRDLLVRRQQAVDNRKVSAWSVADVENRPTVTAGRQFTSFWSLTIHHRRGELAKIRALQAALASWDVADCEPIAS
jgi:hypothetical protein